MVLVLFDSVRRDIEVIRVPQQVQLSIADVIDAFHRIYYEVGQSGRATWQQTYWMGVQVMKTPGDLMMYQELIYNLRPRTIVETGTRNGGSALFFCHMLDLIGSDEGRVITVDVQPPGKPVAHRRLTQLIGSSVAPEIITAIRDAVGAAGGQAPTLVVLDSDHSRDHVLAEMHAYAPLVTPGSYLVVEDTNVNGHPVYPEFGPGPMEAVQAFLAQSHDFEVDQRCEKFILTFNPSGFLRRKTTTVSPKP
jgi:cephalosporin hydroxylase